jgi:Fe2+ or Zn2+ uptake regulation protein
MESSLLQRCQLLSEVESKGIQMTAQRRALIETIQEATAHLDAASLLELAARQASKNQRLPVLE